MVIIFLSGAIFSYKRKVKKEVKNKLDDVAEKEAESIDGGTIESKPLQTQEPEPQLVYKESSQTQYGADQTLLKNDLEVQPIPPAQTGLPTSLNDQPQMPSIAEESEKN